MSYLSIETVCKGAVQIKLLNDNKQCRITPADIQQDTAVRQLQGLFETDELFFHVVFRPGMPFRKAATLALPYLATVVIEIVSELFMSILEVFDGAHFDDDFPDAADIKQTQNAAPVQTTVA